MSAMLDGGNGDRMIIPPRKELQFRFRWSPDLIQRIRTIAKRTNRTLNETGELLMRWAAQQRSVVPLKEPAEQVNFKWPVELIDDVRAIAERTGRTANDAGELLMAWAVQRAESEFESVDNSSEVVKRKK